MERKTDRIRSGDDGIRIVEQGKGPDRGRTFWALALALLMVLVSWRMWGGAPSPNEVAAVPANRQLQAEQKEKPNEQQARHASVAPSRAVSSAAAADPADVLDDDTMEKLVRGTDETAPERSEEENRQIEATARELLQAAVAKGATTGIAAFPPPGTDPIKVGLVVPRDFDLPEGFIRHHQITDDGRRVEPILMFSPDFEFTDANGQPVAVPEDGIVPAEMAPNGLPVRMLAVPRDPYGPSHGAR